jgi:porin
MLLFVSALRGQILRKFLLVLACSSAPAFAAEQESGAVDSSWSLGVTYKADIAGVVTGGAEQGLRFLDNLDVVADVDLDAALGWRGASAHASLLNNLGGRPNDLAGTLQGVNNIEVADARFKLYEAWLEQGFAGGAITLKAGLYDLNSEFYANDSAGLLIAPPFGIGSELSATGPNGPSIFPSTAPAVRLLARVSDFYVQGALVNASAGTIGDRQGIDFSAREGFLMIAEAGRQGRGKVAAGIWTYSKHQPVIAPPDVTLAHQTAESIGGYIIVEQPLFSNGEDEIAAHIFLRGGISDGKTTPFKGGWQLGLLVERPFAGRPASAFSLGIGSGVLSNTYRKANPAGNPPLEEGETVFEVTYSDQILPGVTVQPDFQYVANPAADPTMKDAIVLGLRLTIDLSVR